MRLCSWYKSKTFIDSRLILYTFCIEWNFFCTYYFTYKEKYFIFFLFLQIPQKHIKSKIAKNYTPNWDKIVNEDFIRSRAMTKPLFFANFESFIVRTNNFKMISVQCDHFLKILSFDKLCSFFGDRNWCTLSIIEFIKGN